MFKKVFKKRGSKKPGEASETFTAPEPTPPAAQPTPVTQVAPPTVPAPAPQAAPAPVAPSPPVAVAAPPPAPAPAPPVAVPPAPAPAPPPAPPKARFVPPPAPAPLPNAAPPPKRNVFSAPVKSAAVVTAQGISDDAKKSTNVPAGIPAPDYVIARSNLPKQDHFQDQKPLNFIRSVVDTAPAGLLGSLVGDIQDISYAYMDVNFLQEIQGADQKKKGMLQGAVAHPLGEALQRELAAYQAEKYTPRNVTYYKDMQWGLTANEFYVTTHAEMLDGHNSRTGSWTAKWKISSQNMPGVNEAEISGDVETRAWCYESCTAHMFGSQKFAAVTLQGDAEKPLARVIKLQIIKWEKELIESLNAVYETQMDGTLKKIRRTLPITRTRLKWELIANRAVKKRERERMDMSNQTI